MQTPRRGQRGRHPGVAPSHRQTNHCSQTASPASLRGSSAIRPQIPASDPLEIKPASRGPHQHDRTVIRVRPHGRPADGNQGAYRSLFASRGSAELPAVLAFVLAVWVPTGIVRLVAGPGVAQPKSWCLGCEPAARAMESFPCCPPVLLLSRAPPRRGGRRLAAGRR
jgi:hypothetical protein